MSLQELKSPLRAYWDLSPFPRDGLVDYRAICGEIRAARVLSLNLLDTTVPVSRACIEILEEFRKDAVSISLTISREAFTSSTVSLLSGLSVKSLHVQVSSLPELRVVAERMPEAAGSSVALGISFAPVNGALEDIPEALHIGVRSGVRNFVLPMERLVGGAVPARINRDRQGEIRARLRPLEYGAMRIVVHDPFIWEMIFNGRDFPGGGCQAAHSMVYIYPQGVVYPCPSLPVPLGDLRLKSMRAIFSSEERLNLRKTLAMPAEECRDCGEVSACHGGCRGRAFVLNGDLNKTDPACMRR